MDTRPGRILITGNILQVLDFANGKPQATADGMVPESHRMIRIVMKPLIQEAQVRANAVTAEE